MTVAQERPGRDLFGDWVERKSAGIAWRRGTRTVGGRGAGLRYAFYGHTSTVRFQHRWTSYQWQRAAAEEVIMGAGAIVAEFFDVGYSRELPWTQRPRAAALLVEVMDPARRFDAVVVGEYERVFSGEQFNQPLPLLEAHGVTVWLPEAHGPIRCTRR